MSNPWIVRGSPMGYPWLLHGYPMDTSWRIYGESMAHAFGATKESMLGQQAERAPAELEEEELLMSLTALGKRGAK